MSRINATPVRSAAISQENMMPTFGVAGSLKKPLSATTGPQVRSLKLNEASVNSSKSKLAELMVSTPSARRKLGTVCINTPGTKNSQKSSGTLQGSFKKPHAPALHKEETFVKPLNLMPAQPEVALKAVPSLPTVYEDPVEGCHPTTWKELREDTDPLTNYQLDDLSSMPFDTDSEDGDDSQKENVMLAANVPREQRPQVFFAKPASYRKKKASNFSRLLPLDEICDLV